MVSLRRSKDSDADTMLGDSLALESLRINHKKYVGTIPPDWWLLFIVFSLLLIGTVMVYSASISLGDSPRFNVDNEYFLTKHVISLGVGILVAIIVSNISMSIWSRFSTVLFICGILLLILVLIPGIGKVTNGSARWIPLPFFNLQVTEVMKIATLLYVADFTVRKQDYMHSFKKAAFPMAVAVGIVAVLVLLEPDLGALVMIVVIAASILWLGGLNAWLFGSSILALFAAFAAVILTSPWRMARIFAYLDPWDATTALGKGYQLTHSLIAFGRGEAFGVGLGDAIEKQHYLPEAHTDFILAIIGEELGFVGVIILLFLFIMLVRRCFEIGRQAIKLERFYSGLVAQGVAMWLGVQTFINVGVASGLLPTKGLTLPFVSFGGSALLSCMVAVALVYRVDYENKLILRGGEL